MSQAYYLEGKAPPPASQATFSAQWLHLSSLINSNAFS